jgi:hypothetical protein
MLQLQQDVANTRYQDRLRDAQDRRVRNAFRRTKRGHR